MGKKRLSPNVSAIRKLVRRKEVGFTAEEIDFLCQRIEALTQSEIQETDLAGMIINTAFGKVLDRLVPVTRNNDHEEYHRLMDNLASMKRIVDAFKAAYVRHDKELRVMGVYWEGDQLVRTNAKNTNV